MGVDHVITKGIVAYPSDLGMLSILSPDPHILHYGIDFNIGADYNWNKMIYKQCAHATASGAKEHARR